MATETLKTTIYLMWNVVTELPYVGKTNGLLRTRKSGHVSAAKRNPNSKRKILKAINEYGGGAFIMIPLEKCSSENAAERERYYIEHFDSINNGYNSTKGGEGCNTIDSMDLDTMLTLFNTGKETLCSIANKLNCSPSSIRNKLLAMGVDAEVIKKLGYKNREVHEHPHKPRVVIATGDNTVLKFANANKAAKWLIGEGHKYHSIPSARGHVHEACQGKLKSFAGYKWAYAV